MKSDGDGRSFVGLNDRSRVLGGAQVNGAPALLVAAAAPGGTASDRQRGDAA